MVAEYDERGASAFWPLPIAQDQSHRALRSPAAVRRVGRRRAVKLSSWTVEIIDKANVGSLSAAPTSLGSQWTCHQVFLARAWRGEVNLDKKAVVATSETLYGHIVCT